MVEIMISSTICVLSICFLRSLFCGRMSARVQYSLWSIVALRLFLPWWFTNIFIKPVPSSFCVMNAANSIAKQLTQPESFRLLADNIVKGHIYQIENISPIMAWAIAVDWQLVALILWIAGFCILLFWFGFININFDRWLKRHRQPYRGKLFGITKLPVYVMKELESPCLFGLFGESAIYLPEEAVEEESMAKHMLVHEACHAKQHDIFWGGVRLALVCFYWFHPFVWIAAWMSKQDGELACDAAAIQFLGEEERISYGQTLLKLLKQKESPFTFFTAATTMSGGKKKRKERIGYIAKQPKMTITSGILLCLAVVGILFTTFTSAQAQRGPFNFIKDTSAPAASICAEGKESALCYGEYIEEETEGYKIDQKFQPLIQAEEIVLADAGERMEVSFLLGEDGEEEGIMNAIVYADYWLDETGDVRPYDERVYFPLEEVTIERNTVQFIMPSSFAAILSSKILPQAIMRGVKIQITFTNGKEAEYFAVVKGEWGFYE